MGLETRSQERFPIEIEGECRIHEATDSGIQLNIPQPVVKCKLIDIGMLGCSLDSPYAIPQRTLLEVKADLTPLLKDGEKPARSHFGFVGQVTSCKMKSPGHYRLGLYFMDIRKEDLNVIETYLKSIKK